MRTRRLLCGMSASMQRGWESHGVSANGLTVGVDVVEVSRLARLAQEPGALAGLLTERELEYCYAKRRPAEHIAGRFAAKEAVLKALGRGLAEGIRWTDVETLNDPHGTPVVVLSGGAQALAARLKLSSIDISLSHISRLAIAHAVACWCDAPIPPPQQRSRSMSIRPQTHRHERVREQTGAVGTARLLIGPRAEGARNGRMGTATLAPGERVAEHFHPLADELLSVVVGAIIAELDGIAYPLRSGDALLIGPKVRHCLVNPGSEQAGVLYHLGPVAPMVEANQLDTERADHTASVLTEEAA